MAKSIPYQMNAMEMNPAARATMQLMIFAQRKLFLLSASSGNDACPSCDIELARRTGNGTIPAAYRVTNIM